jgi:flagellar biosynthesis protein FlhF
MLIKKFIASTMNEALAQVKAELGQDAVILQSRKLDKGGLLSLSGKVQVEVTAATPDRHPVPTNPAESSSESSPVKKAHSVLERNRPQHQTLAPPPALLGIREYAQQVESGQKDQASPESDPQVKRKRQTTLPTRSDREGRSDETISTDHESVKVLRSEIDSLKGSIHDLSERLNRQAADKSGDGLDLFRDALRANGCGNDSLAAVLDPLAAELKPSELEDVEALEARLHERIAANFDTTPLDESLKDAGKPVLVAVVGPTGVGKTTSLAKMATNFDMFGRRKVALISTDTYRVAAVEQLRTFAGIAGLPLDVVYRAEELPAAIDRYRNYDVILLDTAGRSQNDEEALAELTEFIDVSRPDRTLLTLSANTRTEDQREVIDNYRRLHFTDILLTKLDEVSSAGHLLDVAMAIDDTPWVYMTTGQAVPDDIIKVDQYLLAAMVVRKEYFLHLRAQGFQMIAE